MKMSDDSKIKLYIHIEKPFYYPGEIVSGSILIHCKEKINYNKIIIIAKGKQLINALDTNNFQKNEENSPSVSSSSPDSDDNEIYNSSKVKIEEKHHIFKFKKETIISKNNFINEGNYFFPFQFELPEEIPGTFLYLDKNIYAEIQYYIKVKLDGLDIKNIVPIVIRQKENVFNYPKFSQYEKDIKGNCYLKLTSREDFTKADEPIKLTVNINNETKQNSTPINIEIYRTLWLKEGKKKKIKRTEIVGTYTGKQIIMPKDNYQKKLHVSLQVSDYIRDHINETKAAKIFKHKEIIPYLFQSIKSENITCEFEIYSEIQFPNIKNNELGTFLKVLIYPIEEGIISKSVAKLDKSFIIDINEDKESYTSYNSLIDQISTNSHIRIIDEDMKNKNRDLIDQINELKNDLNEEKINNQKLEDENNKLKETIILSKQEKIRIKQKLENENYHLKNKIETLKKENKNIKQNLNDKINKLNDTIKNLEKELNNKNIELQNYIIHNKDLNENMITSMKKGEKIISVLFISMGSQDIINYSMPCKNTDLFVKLEENLYKDFPKYKNYETCFEVNGKRIKRFKTVEQNNIKGNSIISMFINEE